MAKVTKGTELWCTIPNRVGVVAGITHAVEQTGSNIIATASWQSSSDSQKGYFKLLTTDKSKTAKAMKKIGYDVKENKVLLLDLPNKPGAFYPISKKIADAGINIDYHYATTTGPKALVVLSTNDNTKALNVIRAS
ncbi:MAG: hypothetical protein QME51_07515 [Planctomycetota bacterium]|nr:hypothetical protein [Planctomycetota bacterium]MDI6788203.1 hypothetical protein [Planctomycetota bacterium]